jgi:NHL repeat
MKKYILLILSAYLAWACGGEKFPLPQQPTDTGGTAVVSDTTYLQLRPVWGAETGYNLNQPQDILLGREPLVYIADTGNDRILMLDLAGNLLGQSQFINHPVALTQDSKLNLLIVTDSNKIYRINLVAVHHQIANAPVEQVFNEVDNPDRRYTGISAVLTTLQNRATIGYYVAATGDDRRDNQVLIFPEDFNVRVPAAVNLEPNGLGILSASSPSGITSLRDFSADFIFCMVGENSFKVQWITPGEFGFTVRLNPAQGNFDIFKPGKFSQPQDVTVDTEGNIYVVDAGLDYLFKFSAAGEEQQSFGGTGSGEKQFKQPSGVGFFDRTLYVADTGNNRIVRFKLSTDIGSN